VADDFEWSIGVVGCWTGGAVIPPIADAIGAGADVLVRVPDGMVVTVASVVRPLPAAGSVEFARITKRFGRRLAVVVVWADVKAMSPMRTVERY
jgi:hypothetical protein